MSNESIGLEPPSTEPEWDEKAFAKLVGFDDEDLEDEDYEDEEFGYEQSGNSTDLTTDSDLGDSNAAGFVEGNVLSDEELFDNPHDNPTPKKLSGNPFAKMAVVGLGLFVAFGTAGYFLTQIMTAGSRIGQAPEDRPHTEEPSADFEDPMVDPENTTGELKTQLALAHQQDQLKALTDDDNVPSLSPVAAEDLEEPPVPPVPVTVSPAPLPPPAPVASRAPIAAAISPPPTAPPISPTEELNNSMTQWQTLAQLGSFERPTQTVATAPAPEPESASAPLQPGQYIQTALSTSAPFPPSAPASSSLVHDDAPTALAPLAFEESRVLEGIPVRRANIGLGASGTLSTPIVWANTELDRRFVVTLETPLVNELDQALLEAGTPIIFQLNAIQDNGLIDASAISVILNSVETPLPEGGLIIRSSKGPLIAKHAGADQRRTPNQLEQMLFGALSGVGGSLLQSGDSISISNGDFSYSSNSGNNNLLGAAIQGAASPILNQITQQISDRDARALAQTDSSNLWYLPTGERIQVYVNLPMEF